MIKRGVSLYCYQQEEFFGRMTWKDQLKEIGENLPGVDGVEIISETTIPSYPMPPESFFFEWNNEMARYGLKAVTMDTYLDTLQFRDHVMTYGEAAERLKYDLRLAAKMGFENMRLCHNIPLEVVEKALPLAEELNVRMTREIHAPSTIKPTRGVAWGEVAAREMAFIQMTGTKHFGLQPDFGIFQNKPPRVMVAYDLRAKMSKEDADKVSMEVLQMWDEIPDREEFMAKLEERYPDAFSPRMKRIIFSGASSDPLDLYQIMPYIFCIHGKFYEMTEIEGEPGHYEDKSIMYKEAIRVLNECRYNGYIDSEYEGQRSQQDMGMEGLANEIEEVRRHQEMLGRLIADRSSDFRI